ncbi:MAG: N-6 DNA methylase [Candidatus Aenigmatarchaeota archaeon]
METVNTYKSNQAKRHFNIKEKILGQFFTPSEVSEFIVSFASNYITEKKFACDPACGDGVFLSSLINYGFEPLGIDIDKDIVRFLPEDIKKYVRIEDGLTIKEDKKFDLVVGNPPFSSKYGRVVQTDILKNFELGKNVSSQAIEILFLEKFIKLCKDGGVIGIILPHGIFSDLRLSYVREYIKRNLSIIAIISLPRNIFRSSRSKTSSKTCILIGKKEGETKQKILFASVNSINELISGEIKRQTFAEPDEFLYPEFYLERNPLLDQLPKLKEFDVEIIQGSTKYGSKRQFSSTGIRFISAKNVTLLGIDFSKEEKFIEPGGIMDNRKAHVKTGDVVFVRVGVGCIGRCAVVTKEFEEGIADDWIYIIRIRDKRLSPFYLAFWLQTATMQREIRRLARGVGTITIPIALFKEIPVPIPDSAILERCEKNYKEMIYERENNNYKKAQRIVEETCSNLEFLLLKKREL